MKLIAFFTYTALVSASAFTLGSAMTERDMLRYVPTTQERQDMQVLRDAQRVMADMRLPIAQAPRDIIEWHQPAPRAKPITIESLIAGAE